MRVGCLTKLAIAAAACLFVSSNAWDACGARHFGYQVCWVNRVGNTLDRLGHTPHHTIASLQALPELVAAAAVAS